MRPVRPPGGALGRNPQYRKQHVCVRAMPALPYTQGACVKLHASMLRTLFV